jgi:hypothetical protein
MDWDYEERRKRERNYRFMFKTALTCIAFSVAMAAVGGVRAAAGFGTDIMLGGLLMFVLSVGSAYLTVDSTVRIIELDAQDALRMR